MIWKLMVWLDDSFHLLRMVPFQVGRIRSFSGRGGCKVPWYQNLQVAKTHRLLRARPGFVMPSAATTTGSLAFWRCLWVSWLNDTGWMDFLRHNQSSGAWISYDFLLKGLFIPQDPCDGILTYTYKIAKCIGKYTICWSYGFYTSQHSWLTCLRISLS